VVQPDRQQLREPEGAAQEEGPEQGGAFIY